ncbi:MAG: SUMF1/EgtB/PvdO family nonheme iron enzyme, partial [bacterium]
AQLTKAHTTVGTAAYMSPEQARGENTDHRTDIWAFGVVLYEMLTGKMPFPGDYEQAVIYSIMNEDPEPVADQCPDIPQGLQQIVSRALAKDPQDRHASTAELLEELQALASTISGQAQSLSFSKLVRKPKFVASAMILLVAIGFSATWSVRYNAKVRRARQELLPEIEQMAAQIPWTGEGLAAWRAFTVATEAERYLADDAVLNSLWPKVSRVVRIHSEPPGASVYARPYADSGAQWRYFGQTPLDSLRFPRGFSWLKLELTGFQTVEDLFWAQINRTSYKLSDPSSIPEGMVGVEGASRELRMPGLDHLKAEHVSRFLMDKYEVTNKDYKRFVDGGGYADQTYWQHPFIKDGREIPWQEAMTLFRDKTGLPGPATWEVGDYPDGEGNYPVAGVSWYEAAAYAQFVGKSLPTVFHWNLTALTWASGVVIPASNLDGAGPAPVGKYHGLTRYGTYDMAGNVREWVLNESSQSGHRFILGGGWNDLGYAFSDAYTQQAFDRSPSNGFRCMKYLEIDENQSVLTRTIDLPFRDFRSEKPVPQPTFDLLVRQYDYDKTALNARVESADDSPEDWVKEKVTFDAGYGGERIIAYLFLPKQGKPPYQAVVSFPGDGGFGARSSASIRPASHFLKSGRAFLYPIYKGIFERGDELHSSMPNESNAYRDHVIMWSKDLRRSIDYLETRDDIDTDRLAYYGVSWGGRMAPVMLVLENRFKTAILYVAGLRFQKARPEADPFNFLPRVTLPVLMLNGKHDFYFPYETSQRPFFQLMGTPANQKKWLVYDGSHTVPTTELVKESLAWLDHYLGPVQH